MARAFLAVLRKGPECGLARIEAAASSNARVSVEVALIRLTPSKVRIKKCS
jgi:hypothetical protein